VVTDDKDQAAKRWTLDPKLDVVFKLLFGSERNKPLLISLLTAILDPPAPIVDVEVLNPEVTKEAVETKASVLDILARLQNGLQVNLEIQAASQGWRMDRGLYYCTRVYSGQLQRGDEYSELKPVVGIFILGFSELESAHYHNKFELLEATTGERLTDQLSLHIIELPKLPPGPPAANGPAVLKWSKFLAATTDEELEQIAMSDPELRQANDALHLLSSDPKARRLAEERRLADINYRTGMKLAREEGREEALREAVLHLCGIFGVEPTKEQRERLQTADPEQAQQILDHLAMHRSWPTT
jgi:predicted transposase/invertase (TIGR01784 family)